jgi:hypothetical protein
MSSGLLRLVVWYKFTDVSEVFVASIISAIALMWVAACTFERLVNLYLDTWRNNPEKRAILRFLVFLGLYRRS